MKCKITREIYITKHSWSTENYTRIRKKNHALIKHQMKQLFDAFRETCDWSTIFDCYFFLPYTFFAYQSQLPPQKVKSENGALITLYETVTFFFLSCCGFFYLVATRFLPAQCTQFLKFTFEVKEISASFIHRMRKS